MQACVARSPGVSVLRSLRWLGASVVLAMVALMPAAPALARGPASTLAEISLRELPREARDLYDRILAGGPFQYDRDGVVFGNREGILPPQKRGYYHEYTVRTPGERTRGARRIVCGGQKRQPEACYYTDDHYQSFRRIRP